MVRSPHDLPKRGVGTPLRERRSQASRIAHDQAGVHEELAGEHVAAARYGRLARSRSSARRNGDGTASHTQGLTLARCDPPGWVNAPVRRSAFCPANSEKRGNRPELTERGRFEHPDDGNPHTGLRDRCIRLICDLLRRGFCARPQIPLIHLLLPCFFPSRRGYFPSLQKQPFTRDLVSGASRDRTGDLLLAKSQRPGSADGQMPI